MRPMLAVLVALACLGVMSHVASAQAALPSPPSEQSVDDPTSPRRVVAKRLPTPSLDTPAPPRPELPHAHHPWARFQPGAWRRTKTTTESFDANGRFLARSVTSQTETLKSVNETSCTIEVVSTVEIGGKRLQGTAQTTVYHLLSEQPVEGVSAERLDTANISLDGAVIPVERWRVQRLDDQGEQTETLYYSPDRSPFLLRREQQSEAGNTSTRSVTRVDAPLLLDGGIVPSSHVRVVSFDGPNQTNRFEVHCDAVPGGLVTASATERDASGRRVRWSTTELEEYGDSESLLTSSRRSWPRLRPFRGRNNR